MSGDAVRDLTPRQREILARVVEEYVATGQPVGSQLLERQEPRPGGFPLDLSALRREVDSALEATTEMLSQVTRLLALVSAPPLDATTVVHVEVLLLQPELVMAVVITSAGGVTKRLFQFEQPVDQGLA